MTKQKAISHAAGLGLMGAWLIWAGALIPASATATWYVATNGVDSNSGTNWSEAFRTISNAIAYASPGELVLVSNGTYSIGAQLSLAKQVTVQGFNGASETIVNGNGSVRCFSLTHAGAVLDGITVSNGVGDGAGINMTAGTVRNCTIRNNKTTGNPGYGNGINMTGGLVTNCVVRDNSRTGFNNGYGGGIWMSGGTVTVCTITGNKYTGASDRSHGAGIEIQGGLVDNCEISSNTLSGATQAAGYMESLGGGAGVLMFGGVVRRCRIYDNANLNNRGSSGSDGGGVYQQAGTLENCLIYNNRSYVNGGGVRLLAGAVCNSTIASNTPITGTGGGLYMSGGGVTNTIVYKNSGATLATRNLSLGGGSFVFGCSDPLPAGAGNIESDPQWRLTTPTDYQLGMASPCIDGGTNLSAVTMDVDGAARPLDGNGDGVARHDMGAYEQLDFGTGPFRCGFSVSTNVGYAPLTVTFTAVVAGANTNGVVYYWDLNNDGTVDQQGADQHSVTTNYGVGTYTVRLIASNNVPDGDQVVRQNLLTVLNDADAYVATNGGSVYPYSTWETAATNLQDAVGAMRDLIAAGGTHHSVWVSNGTYTVSTPILLDSAIEVHGQNGPGVTIIDGNAATRCFTVSDAGAVVDGLTIRNGNDGLSQGSGIRLLSGTVTNCTLTANRGPGRGLYMSGGTVVDSRITNNTVNSAGGVLMGNGTLLRSIISGNQSGAGAGVYISGGTVADSAIQGNLMSSGDNYGAGIYMIGGTVTNCVIRGNQGTVNNGYGGGIWMNNGLVTRSTISGNSLNCTDRCHGGGIDLRGGTVDSCVVSNNLLSGSQYGDTYAEGNKGGAGIALFGGVVRNSLIAGNQNNNQIAFLGQHGGGVTVLAGTVENCTIVRNKASGTGGGLYKGQSAGAVTNTIIYFNTASAASNLGTNFAGVAYSCAPELTPGVNGNLVSDPAFQVAGSGYGLTNIPGDYQLLRASLCANAGTNSLFWMTNSFDLAGARRIQNKIVDVGAYEVWLPPAGFLLMVQ